MQHAQHKPFPAQQDQMYREMVESQSQGMGHQSEALRTQASRGTFGQSYTHHEENAQFAQNGVKLQNYLNQVQVI